MKKIIILMSIIGCFSLAAKKNEKTPEIPDMNAQMKKADKI